MANQGTAEPQQGEYKGATGYVQPQSGVGPSGYTTLPSHPANYDEEAAQEAGYMAGFQDKAVRQGFTRKVLGIVATQLIVTMLFSIAFYYSAPLKGFVQTQMWPFWAAWGLSLATTLVITCSPTARRSYPQNVIWLSIFTLTYGFLVGVITSFADREALVSAFVITAAVVGFVATLAFATDIDFTKFGGILAIVTWAFLVGIIIAAFWHTRIVYLVISVIGAIIFSLYLLYDLQMLMGGKTQELSPDEYIFASMTIYLDVIQIFLNILQALQASDN
ncbi:hypothetical protein WJX74_005555 [Apatococcus lobatus]|uniref:Uncharacterized protein n=1 Tax=Apatococcus lobatus TaxID=904363 RepID=A0AAW1S9R2_9CHLO